MLTDEEICCDQMLREMYRYRRKELYEDGTKIAEIGYEESQRAYHILNSRDPDNNDYKIIKIAKNIEIAIVSTGL